MELTPQQQEQMDAAEKDARRIHQKMAHALNATDMSDQPDPPRMLALVEAAEKNYSVCEHLAVIPFQPWYLHAGLRVGETYVLLCNECRQGWMDVYIGQLLKDFGSAEICEVCEAEGSQFVQLTRGMITVGMTLCDEHIYSD